METTISIIIPVYNTFKHMEKCLESLIKQNNKNFEVIFVDDSSTDGTYELLKNSLSNVDYKYKIIRNSINCGPGNSRNVGIENTTTQYITFLDADDYICENFVDSILKVIENSNSDFIIFDYFKVRFGDCKKCSSINGNKRINTIHDLLALSNGMCWGKIYKKDIIKKYNIRFPDIMRSEDLAFVKVYIDKCRNFYYFKKNLYYYVFNSESIMNNCKTMDVKNNKIAIEYIKKNTEKSEAVDMIYIREYFYLTIQIMILNSNKKSKITQFIDDNNRTNPKWYKNKYIKYQPLYLKILFILIRFKFINLVKLIFKLKK